MNDDELLASKESKELARQLTGQFFLYRDVTYSIFENYNTIPNSLTFLMKVPIDNSEYGVLIGTNFHENHYAQAGFRTRKELNRAYAISKRKILSKEGLKLGWEGYINDPKFS